MDFHKRIIKNEPAESFHCYISPNSYNMALLVYANGSGDAEGTHVSVFAKILRGRYDAQLKWPLVGDITFKLLNQLEDKNHYQKTVQLTAEKNMQAGSDWGYPTFICHTKLGYNKDRNTQYLKDDTLYFRMSVEVADHKPWLE